VVHGHDMDPRITMVSPLGHVGAMGSMIFARAATAPRSRSGWLGERSVVEAAPASL